MNTFYEAMIDSQLHKISYKSILLQSAFCMVEHYSSSAYYYLFGGKGGTLFGYPLRFATSVMYSMVPYSH